MKKQTLTLLLMTCFFLVQSQNVLFVRGGDNSGGWLEFPQFSKTEQLADITNFTNNQTNHGWGEFAATLRNNGYTVTQIKEGGGGSSPINFAGMNLAQYDIIVLGSNNAPYNNAQVNAIDNWVKNGGGLLTISDTNFGSSWCDAPNSDQAFLNRYGIIVHQDRGFYTLKRNNGDFLIPNHPILNGVNSFEGEGVSPFKLANTIPSGVTVQKIVRAKDKVRLNDGPCTGRIRNVNNGDLSLITATAGRGRVVGYFDRNTFFNRNGAGSNINKFDNKRFMLNIFAWLANGGGGNDNPPPGGTPDVNCATLPTSVASSTALAVSVNYTADQNRDVVIELWRNNQYIKEGRTAVTAGTGTANVTINVNGAPAAGSNYLLKASIRPTGTDWRQNLDACNRTNVAITSGGGGNDNPPPGGTPDVNCTTLPASVASNAALAVSVNYTSDQNRDVVIELWKNNQYLKEGRTAVTAGSGTANVIINLNSAPAAGTNYLLKASIRPTGTDWRQNLDACNRTNVAITSGGGGNDNPPPGGTPDVNCNTLPGTLTSGTSIPVSINYNSDQNRDVVVELWRGSQYLTQKKTTVGAGSGVANVTLNLNSPPPAGGNYLLKSSIRPVGADWRQSLDACNRNNITVSANFANRSSSNALEKVKLYPNILAGNLLNIDLPGLEKDTKKASVAIYNSRGKMMQQQNIAFRSKSKTQLKVSPLIDNGVYFIKIFDGTHLKIKRVVIRR